MKDDILGGISHLDLTAEDKAKYQIIMVTATLAVHEVARMPGMDWDRRDIYRKVLIGKKIDDLTSHEIEVFKNLSIKVKNAVQEVESIKYRLLQGHVRLLLKCVCELPLP
jgi:hypothetical protein